MAKLGHGHARMMLLKGHAEIASAMSPGSPHESPQWYGTSASLSPNQQGPPLEAESAPEVEKQPEPEPGD